MLVWRNFRGILLLLLLIILVVEMQLRYIPKLSYWKILINFSVPPFMRRLLWAREDIVGVLYFRLFWEHFVGGDATENALSLF